MGFLLQDWAEIQARSGRSLPRSYESGSAIILGDKSDAETRERTANGFVSVKRSATAAKTAR
jgi:hypothetical protein